MIVTLKYGKTPAQTLTTEREDFTVGRGHEAVDIDLSPDINVSRKHARITFEHGEYWIEDLGSKHGTWVSGERISGKARIASGITVRVGGTELHFDSAAANDK